MFLKKIQLTNFRNFAELDLNFESVTLVIGENAQGKSNLLESIFFLATTKSLRVERDYQLIKEGTDFARVEGEVIEDSDQKSSDITNLEIALQKSGKTSLETGLPLTDKKVQLNGISKRVNDYVGHLVVIFFSPEDINLVTDSPSLRRSYLDLTLSQSDSEYKRAISVYNSALTARNKLLKRIREGFSGVDELDFWTEKIIDSGEITFQKRRSYFEFLNEVEPSFEAAVGSFGKVSFVYRPSQISKEKLVRYLDREIAAAATLIGPHRDDFIFELNGQNLAFFGSRGQQRLAVLDLKLGELQFFEKVKNITPVLLLDDIFSELDESRRAHVISIITPYQTILTAIDIENIPQKFLEAVKVVKIKLGNIVG